MVAGKLPALRWSVPNDQPVDWVSPAPIAADRPGGSDRCGASPCRY